MGAAFLNSAKVAVAYELLTLVGARHSAEYLALHHMSIDVSGRAGQPVRLRFTLRDADLYSLQSK